MPEFNHRYEHIDDNMFKVEINLDDMTPEMIGHLMDRLFAVGANDVYYTPIYMKKNRPAVLLTLLCSADVLPVVKKHLFVETTTFGLRYYPISVHRLERSFISLSTPWGDITVKQAFHQGKLVEQSPEFEECARAAQAADIPLKDIYQYIWAALQN
ncbi:nickel insertion protein [Alteribacillus sp. HJP-4]|uniref:nickel insertion protein n=1 Tax=Alteribacillus sp. HJP-4 TaxID=2775394 RepID=UPI0035CCD269